MAVDPGGTVGYALYPRSALSFDPVRMTAGQAPVEEFIDWAYQSIQPDWIVLMEKFTITTNTAKLTAGGAHDALDCIGTVKSVCRWRSARYHVQAPGQAKGFVSDAQLKSLGLWVKSKDHARDAIRHLVFGLVYHTHGQTCEDLKLRMTS